MDGRDQDTMDKILHVLNTAVHGLPVSFEPVAFDTPLFMVYVNDQNTGSLHWTADFDGEYAWWSVSIVAMSVTSHGNNVRAALARQLNDYIDKYVGLA